MSGTDEAPPDSAPDPASTARRPRLTRRRLLGLVAGGMTAGALHRLLVVDPPPRLDDLSLSPAARAFVARCWEGLDPRKVVDIHVHVIGLGVGGTGCFVHPDATSLLSPVRWVKTRFYKGAAGIYDDARADPLYVERLVDLCAHQRPRGRFLLLAFDKHHDAAGRPDLDRTEFYTPNAYVARLAHEHPDLFLFAASVHPYRPDAIEALERCREIGAVAVKWLPNAMGIDPADPRCDPFYEFLARHRWPLVTHTGEEQAVHAEEAQELGNPLRLRRALDHGVAVVAAHCASLGESRDLDAPADPNGRRPRKSSFALFRRLAGEPRARGRLFGGLSAMTQFNRCGEPLRSVLSDPSLRPLLVNGSDYPLPAIDPLIRTGLLVDEGYISAEERVLINEVYAYDPLLFDFVLKRSLKVEREGTVHRLPTRAFETARLFPAASPARGG